MTAADDWAETREKIARVIDPSKWRVLDSQFQHVLHRHRSYEVERFKDKDSLAKADSILKLIEAARRSDDVGEGEECKTCRGNGEIVTDWDRYLGPAQPGDQGDEGTADCPDCDGQGTRQPVTPAGEG